MAKTICALHFVKATGLQKYGVYLLNLTTVVWGVWLQARVPRVTFRARLQAVTWTLFCQPHGGSCSLLTRFVVQPACSSFPKRVKWRTRGSSSPAMFRHMLLGLGAAAQNPLYWSEWSKELFRCLCPHGKPWLRHLSSLAHT